MSEVDTLQDRSVELLAAGATVVASEPREPSEDELDLLENLARSRGTVWYLNVMLVGTCVLATAALVLLLRVSR